MPRAKRRCSKYPACKAWQPCPQHPQRYSERGKGDLPSNWKALVRQVQKVRLCQLHYEGCTGWGQACDHKIPRFYFRDRGLPVDDSLGNLQWVCHYCHHLKGREDLKRYKKK